MINAILACDQDWGIGKAGTLPWPHNSADLKWFKETTVNCTVVMGRKTWESLPIKPLPNRENVVISRGSTIAGDGIVTIAELNSLFKICRDSGKKAWIIGGAQLVNQLLPYIDSIHLSRIEGVYDCDTFLPSESIIEQFALYDAAETDSGLYIEQWARK
jgi:dihydrofolate reductase